MNDDPKPRGYNTLREAMLAIIKHEQDKQRAATYSGRKKRTVIVPKRTAGVAEPTCAMAARPGPQGSGPHLVPLVCPRSECPSDRAWAVSKRAGVCWIFLVPRGGIEPPTP
ncbi:MAG: hypothetical protein WAU74_27385 [Pseudolabrys sp.]